MIAAARKDDPMFKKEGLHDPSDEIFDVLIQANDWNMLSRKRIVSVDQIVSLDQAAKQLITSLKQIFPERTGTTDASGNFIGWNTEKIHSLLHNGRNIMWYGCADVTSAQGPERCHKDLIKKIGHLHDNKSVFLSLMRFHARVAQVHFLKQSIELSDVDGILNHDLVTRSDSERVDKNISIPCELGIRYPVLQAAMDRSQVVIQAKVHGKRNRGLMRMNLFLLRTSNYAPSQQHKVLKYLPTTLAEFLYDNYYDKLGLDILKDSLDLEDKSVQFFDFILNECVVAESDGTHLQTFGMIEFENKQFYGKPKARCYPFKKFHGKNPQVVQKYMSKPCLFYVF